MNKLKDVIKDILYVSKLTGIKNKKIIIASSIILSQLTAVTDLALIAVFAAVGCISLIYSAFFNFFTVFLLFAKLC